MTMEVIDSGSRFDPTPEQLHAKAKVDWQVLLDAMEVEQKTVLERVGQLESQLVGFDQGIAAATTRHAAAVLQIDRAAVADRLDHAKTSRLPAIADAISAHRKARP